VKINALFRLTASKWLSEYLGRSVFEQLNLRLSVNLSLPCFFIFCSLLSITLLVHTRHVSCSSLLSDLILLSFPFTSAPSGAIWGASDASKHSTLAPLTSRQPHTHSMSNKNQLFSSGNKWRPCFYGSMNYSAILDITLLLSRCQWQQIRRSALEVIRCDRGIWNCMGFGVLKAVVTEATVFRDLVQCNL